jgi:hypothetical protein
VSRGNFRRIKEERKRLFGSGVFGASHAESIPVKARDSLINQGNNAFSGFFADV